MPQHHHWPLWVHGHVLQHDQCPSPVSEELIYDVVQDFLNLPTLFVLMACSSFPKSHFRTHLTSTYSYWWTRFLSRQRNVNSVETIFNFWVMQSKVMSTQQHRGGSWMTSSSHLILHFSEMGLTTLTSSICLFFGLLKPFLSTSKKLILTEKHKTVALLVVYVVCH